MQIDNESSHDVRDRIAALARSVASMIQLISLELLINVSARAVFGLMFAGVLGIVSWSLIWFSYRITNSDSAFFFPMHVLMVGGPAAVGAALAWWNTQSSGRVHWLSFVLILGTTLVSTWLVIEIRGVDSYNALFRGVFRVPVISTGDMLTKLITAAVLSGNAVAAIFYLYRALRHNEV